MKELKRNKAGGFDVVHYDGVLIDFWKFVDERISITEKKNKGCIRPWSDDEILNTVKLINIDRRQDHGTKYILNSELKRIVQIIFIYRMSGSNIKLMDKLIKHCINDWSEIMKHEVIFNSSAYQRPNFPKGLGSGRFFMTEHAVNFSRELESHLKTFNGTIKELVVWMCDQYVKLQNEFGIPYKRMLFHSNEIAKDLSYFFEGIDPHSDCEIGIGAKKGLKLLFNTTQYDRNFNLLQHVEEYKQRNFTPELLENSLCEFRKYREYKSGKKIRPNNIYKPRS